MEISTEKSETIAFLGQDPVRCKFVVDNKCLQQAKNSEYLYCEISYANEVYSTKTSEISQMPGFTNNTLKPTLVLKIFRNITM
jgi:hypothetical protein